MTEQGWVTESARSDEDARTEAQLLEAYWSGALGARSRVRKLGETEWRPLGEAIALRDAPSDFVSDPGALVDEMPGWERQETYAWRRYFCRRFDALGALIFAFFIGGAVSSFAPPGMAFGVGALMFFLPNALMVGVLGRTVGKFIFGLKVLKPDKRPPGVGRAFARELYVLIAGLGLFIPLVSFITAAVSYARLKDVGSTFWDDGLDTVVWYRKPSGVHWALMVGGVFVFVAGELAIAIAAAALSHVQS